MTALVIGASGLVGRQLVGAGRARGILCVGAARHTIGETEAGAWETMDVRDAASVGKVFEKHGPDLVFLPASLTNVDYCEDHPAEAHATNVDGVAHVVEACRRFQAKLVYVSTDYVFDGQAGPYDENAAPHPLGVYAKTKLEGERLVLGLGAGLVVRTTVVYDWDPYSKNFIMSLLKKLLEKNPMKVPKDQWGHPTLARNLTQAMWALAEAGGNGVFHFVGPDYIDRHGFAVQAARAFQLDESLLIPVATKDLGQKAERPLKGGLLTHRARGVLSMPFIGIQEGLALVKRSWEASHVGFSQR